MRSWPRVLLKAAMLIAFAASFFACKKSFAAPFLFAVIIDTRTGKSPAEMFCELPKDIKEKRWNELTDDDKAKLATGWQDWDEKRNCYVPGFWARPNQVIPPEPWQVWMIMAGRGNGKTRTGAETVREWVKENEYVNIIAPTADDARDICIEGESGILKICPPLEQPKYLPSQRKLQWPNGAVSLIFTADEPERLRGKQHMKIWADELASWRYLDEAWTQASLGLRLGKNPQAIVTTTPKPLPAVREIANGKDTFLTKGTTYDNRINLAKAFFSRIIVKYEGTRLGRQELQAELLTDNPDALFQRAWIESTRFKDAEYFWQIIFPKLYRVVGAIDPAVSSNEDSDETGIIFCGALRWKDVPEDFKALTIKANPILEGQDHYVTFDDRSDIYTPEKWGRAAIAGYYKFKADRIIGEKNNGGDMIESTLRNIDENVSYLGIHASRGKETRAEPVSAVYQQLRVHHVGNLGGLEDQMCDYNPKTCIDSPDRMDADVWALTELIGSNTVLGLTEFFAEGGKAKEVAQKLEVKDKTPPELAAKATGGSVSKPVECPGCKSTLTALVAGGQYRCMQCGNQWNKEAVASGAPEKGARAKLLEENAPGALGSGKSWWQK